MPLAIFTEGSDLKTEGLFLFKMTLPVFFMLLALNIDSMLGNRDDGMSRMSVHSRGRLQADTIDNSTLETHEQDSSADAHMHKNVSSAQVTKVDAGANASAEEAKFKCNNWCFVCGGTQRPIYVTRSQHWFANVVHLTGLAVFGPLAPMLTSSLNSMNGGCSQVEFQPQDGLSAHFDVRALMRNSALLGSDNDTHERTKQSKYAQACSAIKGSQSFGISSRTLAQVKECGRHAWLCGEDGVERVENIRVTTAFGECR